MALKCDKCSYEGLRNEFRVLCRAADPSPDLYRQCPKCKCAVYSDELELDEQSPSLKIWGLSSLRGQVFRREKKDANEKKG
ncbi:MAG: hypothetical protein Q7J12_07080 [Syntrophales bacterium]|nr:hypothetical protein [Syntrophales bacterium]